MRTSALARIVIVALTLALGLLGCGQKDGQDVRATSPSPAEDPSSQPPTMPLAPPAHSGSLSYLDGVWAVTANLTEVDEPALADAVIPASGEWELVVLGDSMTVHLGDLRYEGLLTPEGEGWSYFGFVTGSSETGEMLTGTLEFRGTLTGDDAFSGSAIQSVDAAADRPAYTAHWELTGVHQP